MIFSSILFLYLFLPVVLILYYSVGYRFRNFILLGASLLFYAWGELGYVLLMLFSIASNWLIGLSIDNTRSRPKVSRLVLGAGIALNLSLLAFFKYGNFFADNLNVILDLASLGRIDLEPVHLPIGISFFTFQAMSYIIDVYRNHAMVQRRPVQLALYISLFPQLIAGPIVRYSDVALQIVRRSVSLEDFQCGIQRFVLGLGKKVLIANTMGAVADHIFSLPSETLPANLLWLGMITYTLQIYYDFSGYSDMAIGLGRMFGFRFPENFNYPYSATSIQDFWRRWHISLSSWFRDYLYIPLGGNRKGAARTYFNMLAVFFFCGLWHGASWTFIAWGLYHGLFLVMERLALGKILKTLPRLARHLYTATVFMVGWVFFRAESLPKALDFLSGLGRFDAPPYLDAQLFAALNSQFYITIFVGIFFAFPVMPTILGRFHQVERTSGFFMRSLLTSCKTLLPMIWMALIIIYSSAQIISGTHNPFLYFRF
jgi:alginate O-acetyltransferase complex protein AlgI